VYTITVTLAPIDAAMKPGLVYQPAQEGRVGKKRYDFEFRVSIEIYLTKLGSVKK